MANKTRVHDLAAEFGIPSEQLLPLLADLDIHVRSHLSSVDDAQAAIVRSRWEREKRKKAEPESKPRRTARRKAQAPAPAPIPEPEDARPRRRRRTAADVAARQAAEDAEAAVREEAERLKAEEEALRAIPEGKPSLEERAAALFRDVPAVSDEHEEFDGPTSAVSPSGTPADQATVTEMRPAAGGTGAPSETRRPAPARPMRIQRPSTGIKPVASAAPRPVASATPAGESAEDRHRDKGKGKRKKGKRSQVDREAVAANVSRTMAALKGTPTRGKKGRRTDEPSFRQIEEQRRKDEQEREKTLVRVNEFITVSELAGILNASRTDVVSFCFKELGMMVTVNQRLDFDQIELIAGAFGFQAVQEEEYVDAEVLEDAPDAPETLTSRPPVVTVMGHVDHGKTSLLDHIRKSNVIAGEAGGITQHIGAYHVLLPGGRGLTFLDTPGHQAFTAMRARGAQVTDLVVLVVAADDQVMPQTVEAISHAKNAGVPMIVAINKIDLPAANVEKVKQDLLKHDVILEEFGGDVMAQAMSAKVGTGVDALLEKILLQADMLDKRANPDRDARGTVIESTLDPGKGPLATVLIQAGTLKIGQDFICGNMFGRVRAMLDERGKRVEEAGPSIPIQVLGFDGVPVAGDNFVVVPDSQQAREIAQKRQRLDREAQHRRSSSRGVSLEDLASPGESGGVQSLKIIIKADQGGPAEALADAFAQLSTAEVKVEVIHRGVGAITESDILLAKASGAVVVGFHVRPDANARAAAEREKVDIRTYRVIYEAVEEIKAALEGMLRPEEKEVILGEADVRETFKISGVGVIAGCYLRHGVIKRSNRVRVVRDGVEVYAGGLSSLKRFKDDVREVREGLECGIGIENFNDVKVGDVLEAFEVQQIARSLESAAGAPKDA